MKILSTFKNVVIQQIEKSILRQKNEWPATSVPVFFQPERPKTDNSSSIKKY